MSKEGALRRAAAFVALGTPGPLSRAVAATFGLAAALGRDGPWLVVALALGAGAVGLGVVPLGACFAVAAWLLLGGLPLWGVWGVLVAVGAAVGWVELLGRARAAQHWDARSHGGYFGHWFFYQVTRLLGVRSAYAWLYPVVAYFTLKARRERAASERYLEAALGPARGLSRWRRTYRHFFAFARSLLDGAVLGAHGPKVFHCEHEGIEHLRAAGQSGKGAVLLTAHLGTWEVASGLLEDQLGGAEVAVVMFRGDEAALQQFLEAVHGRRPRLIAVGEGDLASLEILHALRDGALVAMQGDRSVDARDVVVPFLGRPARWPIGPWVLAATSGAPVIAAFALQAGPLRYHFVADPPRTVSFDRKRPREEQLAEWVGAYVARVEALVREHPFQWFNFFDFWAERPKLPAAAPTPRRV